jgi:hypothetical protein
LGFAAPHLEGLEGSGITDEEILHRHLPVLKYPPLVGFDRADDLSAPRHLARFLHEGGRAKRRIGQHGLDPKFVLAEVEWLNKG